MKLVDAPRLPKLPFILGDIMLVLVAGLIANRHPNPVSPLPLSIITGCVVIACGLSVIPFLVNYVRDQEEVAAALRHELGEQFKRLMAASEHLQHATAQLKTIEEIATKNLQAAEKLPYRLQEKIAEFNQHLAEAHNEERETLEQELTALRSTETERLEAIAGKMSKEAAEFAKLEAEARSRLATATQLEQKLADLLAAVEAKIHAFHSTVATADQPAPIPSPPRATEAKPAMGPAEAAVEAAPAAGALPATETPVLEKPKPPRKPRAPKKPVAEEPIAEARPAGPVAPASVAQPAELIAEPVDDESPAPENFSQLPPEEHKTAPVAATDGHTRLTVVSYVGIGNKLYLRGEGPGLTWEKGVPLQFVSIGRWRWETDEATTPVICKVYKNDKIEAPLGQLTLPPGTEQEVTAAF